MIERIPTLTTARLAIRELTMDDLEAIHAILNAAFEASVPLGARERWLQWTVLGYDMFEVLEQPHYGERAITLRETGELIGAVGIVPYIDWFESLADATAAGERLSRAEVGLFWAVAPAQQGKGYASEAAGAVVDYLFGQLKLRRVIATTGAENVASQGVMRKIGMAVSETRNARDEPVVVGVLEKV